MAIDRQLRGKYCVVVRCGNYEDDFCVRVYGPCTKKRGLEIVNALGSDVGDGRGNWESRTVAPLAEIGCISLSESNA